MHEATSKNVCICGKEFAQVNGLNNHLRTCKIKRKRVSTGLARAKEAWMARKHKRQKSSEDANGDLCIPVWPQFDPSIIETGFIQCRFRWGMG